MFDKCDDCGNETITKDDHKGIMVCTHCGLIQEYIIDMTAEWKNFPDEKNIARAEISDSRVIKTLIPYSFKDATGVPIPAKRQRLINRIRKQHDRQYTYKGYNKDVMKILIEIDKISANKSLPKFIREYSKNIYLEAHNGGIAKGKQKNVLIPACIYLACRMKQFSRSIDDILEDLGVSKKKMKKMYRLLIRSLNYQPKPRKYDDFIVRVTNELSLPTKIASDAISIFRASYKRYSLSGKNPACVAAGAIFTACVINGHRRSQEDIATALGVTSASLRIYHRKFTEFVIESKVDT